MKKWNKMLRTVIKACRSRRAQQDLRIAAAVLVLIATVASLIMPVVALENKEAAQMAGIALNDEGDSFGDRTNAEQEQNDNGYNGDAESVSGGSSDSANGSGSATGSNHSDAAAGSDANANAGVIPIRVQRSIRVPVQGTILHPIRTQLLT